MYELFTLGGGTYLVDLPAPGEEVSDGGAASADASGPSLQGELDFAAPSGVGDGAQGGAEDASGGAEKEPPRDVPAAAGEAADAPKPPGEPAAARPDWG